MSSEEKEELMTKNMFGLLKQLVGLLVFKYWIQTAAFVTVAVTICVFYLNTRETNTEFPKLKQDFIEHERQESLNRQTDRDMVKDLASDVKVLIVKVDDIKKYGKGEYHEQTVDSMKTIIRHKR